MFERCLSACVPVLTFCTWCRSCVKKDGRVPGICLLFEIKGRDVSVATEKSDDIEIN